MMRIINSFLLVCLATICIGQSNGGMWLPNLLAELNEEEMQSLGMQISAQDIYDVNTGSLKDAIVHFGGFCTGEVISAQGLVLTNHHCGYGQIQSHSTVEDNYLDDGFWAMDRAEELPNPGLYVKFINKIEDVTAYATNGVTDDMSLEARNEKIGENLKIFEEKASLGEFEELEVKAFYAGNQYYAFYTISYPDVRLVGAPPSSIGKFGADTDNWVWPRHTGDFSLFRIYADKNNNPAAYSEDNVPYTPKHYLPINISGAEEGDFTMVFGFPGRTNEYLPASAVAQTAKVVDPARVAMRDVALKVMDKYMRADEATKIKYASKFASIANYWKKWIGEMQGLERSKAVAKKSAYEQDFQSRLETNQEWQTKYGTLLAELNETYAQLQPYAEVNAYHSELTGRNTLMLNVAYYMDRLANLYETDGPEAYESFKGRLLNYLQGQYKNYDEEVEAEVFAALINLYFEKVPGNFLDQELMPIIGKTKEQANAFAKALYKSSQLTNFEQLEVILALPAEEAIAAIQTDEMLKFYQKLNNPFKTTVEPYYKKYNDRAIDLQRTYMEAQLEVFSDKRFFPDANSTMRVTYGQVKGYYPKDAVYYGTHTYLDGVMEKYVPGDYEFDVPTKLIHLHNKKDYGDYAAENGKLPVNFIASNHTTGGNSGSPAIDANGNLIGLNFDRAWEGTMSDINYDPAICRNIMVDARYILFIIDKYAGAEHLIKEMTLVK
jgi:hypothetical protein